MALARYAPSKQQWTNRWGKSFDFDSIASQLLGRPVADGSCHGIHLLQALSVILRVDSIEPILSAKTRSEIHRHLASAVSRLRESQRPDGYWAPDWPTPHGNQDDYSKDRAMYSEDQLALVTGHHLEWLDLVGSEVALPATSLQAAVNWCKQQLIRVTKDDVKSHPCAYSHCFRAVKRRTSPASRRE